MLYHNNDTNINTTNIATITNKLDLTSKLIRIYTLSLSSQRCKRDLILFQ